MTTPPAGARPQVRLMASIGPRASWVILRNHGKELTRLADSLASVPGNERAAADLRMGLESMKLCAAQMFGGVPAPAAGDTVEEQVGRVELSTAEVADRLGFSSPRHVINLIGDGTLWARRVKGVWRVDAASVAAYADRRSEDRK